MDKKQAHFEAFGYEPLRMKPAHFASGFFIALTERVYANELLNKVAVIKANKGLVEGYAPEAVRDRLRGAQLIAGTMTLADVELLRMQINGVVNNDEAMYGAFSPYKPKGNDYTFISPRVLTRADRTDGYAGHFMVAVLAATDAGNAVLKFARNIASQSPSTLERFVQPLMDKEESESFKLADKYEDSFGELTLERIEAVAGQMRAQTDALARLCENLTDYSHYRRIRYLVLGLLAWLMNYLLRTAAVDGTNPLLLFDFLGAKEGLIRAQSQACYARLRDAVGRSYQELAKADRFSTNPITAGVFARKKRGSGDDFQFLEEHFGTLAMRGGYSQPRASRVRQKHLDLQPDTLRALMLSILHRDAERAITFDDVCAGLKQIWNIVCGGASADSGTLQQQGYYGFDEAELQRNAAAFAGRLKSLNLAVEPSDGLVLCSKDFGGGL